MPRPLPNDPRFVKLIEDYKQYDRVVDIVSIFEWLYTETNSLPKTVKHFERFPTIAVGNVTYTPDFTVLFQDHPVGLVGEIAQFSLADQSVEDLCSQLAKYDALKKLQAQGGYERVKSIDTLLIVPTRLGVDAVRRVVRDRFQSSGHAYKPSRPPCIVQFSYDDGKYLLQRMGNAENGVLRDSPHGEGIGSWLEDGSIAVSPRHFAEVKAARAFVNDPVDSLYLATHLWSKTFPTKIGGLPGNKPISIEVDPSEWASEIRTQHGWVRSNDVKHALELLQRATLAEKIDGGRWRVAWANLGNRSTDKDLAQILAKRSLSSPVSGPLAQIRRKEKDELESDAPRQLALKLPD